jgi:hypothetical protein
MTNSNTKYVVVKDYGTINKRTDALGNTWYKRVRLVSWNGRKALFDIREWSADDNVCRSGMRLNWQEIDALEDVLKAIREEQRVNDEAAGAMDRA